VLRFDHLAFGVASVDAAREAFAALGLTVTATGVCRWSGQGRSHEARAVSIVFSAGYLDLVELAEAGWDEHLRSSSLYAHGIAPTGVVLGTAALAECRVALSTRGVAVGRPYEIVRELPGATPSRMRYEMFPLREPALPFAVIADGSPDALRTAEWLRHPSSAVGVHSLHLRVPSLQTWRARSSLLLGESAERDEVDLRTSRIVPHEEPSDPYLRAVSALLPARERTSLLAIELAVEDATAARAALTRGNVPTVDVDGGIGVDPSAGFGCGFVFREARR
jgi:hypothetical protein